MADRDPVRMLLCRLPTGIVGLPLEQVIETMRPLDVEPLSARAPAFVKGVSVIRGVPVPVLDTGRLLGAHTTEPRRFVTVKSGTRTVALAFDDVLGVGSIGRESLHDLPPLLRDVDADLVAAIGTLDAELLLVLTTARLIPEEFQGNPETTRGAV